MKALHRLTIISLVVLSATASSYSQRCKVYGLHKEDFESKPWYGNNQNLTDFLTAREIPFTSCPVARYHIQVKMGQSTLRQLSFSNISINFNI